MIESQQNREIVLRQLALAWEEGWDACHGEMQCVDGIPVNKPKNPYREEKEDE